MNDELLVFASSSSVSCRLDLRTSSVENVFDHYGTVFVVLEFDWCDLESGRFDPNRQNQYLRMEGRTSRLRWLPLERTTNQSRQLGIVQGRRYGHR